jgi:asparagine synthase (glutamine-hydrolysing)
MCGILGYISNTSISDKEFYFALKKLHHRGPDFINAWTSEDGLCRFGHTRLAIIDLDKRSNQPFIRIDLNLSIVFNGEIYNFKDIKKRLDALNYTFLTNSDTEILLLSYHAWGENLLHHIRGMFAFAVYDKNRQIVFGARDRAGEKPFFYFHENNTFGFSSELKSLIAFGKKNPIIDDENLDYLFAYGYSTPSGTLLSDYKKLNAGECFKYSISRNVLTIRKYWELPEYIGSDSTNENLITSNLYELLKSSIKEQLTADVPVGILLSGGLDSSIVAALAAEEKRIKTFTVTFPNHSDFNEAAYAKQVADYIKSDHIELKIENVDCETIIELAKQFDDPIFDSSMIPTYLVSKLVKQYCTVALGGDGGDELFGGYNWYSSTMQYQKTLNKLPHQFRFFTDSIVKYFNLNAHRYRYWIEELTNSSEIIPLAAGFYSPAQRDKFFPRLKQFKSRAELLKLLSIKPFDTYLKRAMHWDFSHYMKDDVLVKVDRSSMLASLETRAPFLDKRIIEFAFSKVPDNLKATISDRKILLRSIAKKVLPTNFNVTRKQGFGIPIYQWLEHDKKWISFYFDTINSLQEPIFRSEAQKMVNGKDRYVCLIFALWVQHYNVEFNF